MTAKRRWMLAKHPTISALSRRIDAPQPWR
jgi:hypothetical protein